MLFTILAAAFFILGGLLLTYFAYDDGDGALLFYGIALFLFGLFGAVSTGTYGMMPAFNFFAAIFLVAFGIYVARQGWKGAGGGTLVTGLVILGFGVAGMSTV